MADVKHISGEAGGYLVGRRHSTGGIKAINKATGQPLEMEGGEVVITRNAVSDTTKRSFNGKMMTNREILSTINQSGGGVAFADGGEVPENIYFDIDEEFEYGGKVMCGKDLSRQLAYGAELDDIVDEALAVDAESFEEGGVVTTEFPFDVRFTANAKEFSWEAENGNILEWVYTENSADATSTRIFLNGRLRKESGGFTDLKELERRVSLQSIFALSNIGRGAKLSDAIQFLSEEYRILLNEKKDDATEDGLPIGPKVINQLLDTFLVKSTPNVAALFGVEVFEPSPLVTTVTSYVDESELISVQEYADWNEIWPKNPNYKGYESLMRKVVKGLPNYEKKEVVLKLSFRTISGKSDSVAIVYVPVKLDMRKVKWSEMQKLIAKKTSWSTSLKNAAGTYMNYHLVLDNAEWSWFNSDNYVYEPNRANTSRGQKLKEQVIDFINEHKANGTLRIYSDWKGLFDSSMELSVKESTVFGLQLYAFDIIVFSLYTSDRVKASFGISASSIFIKKPNGDFIKIFLDEEAKDRLKAEREAKEKAEAEAQASEEARLAEIRNRPIQVRDQPEDEALFSKEVDLMDAETMQVMGNIEAVRRLIGLAKGQTLSQTRFALIKKLRKLEERREKLLIAQQSPQDDSDNKLISPLGLFNYYFTQTRQNPTAKMGKPSGLPTPTGVPSKLDIQSYYAVRTNYFKKWFGDWEIAAENDDYRDCSVMVDPDTKEPRIMYHGVRYYVEWWETGAMGKGVLRPYGEFKAPNFPATFFGDDFNYVNYYTGNSENQPKPFEDYEGFMYSAFLNLRRPIFIDNLGETATYADLYANIAIKYGLVLKKDPLIARTRQGVNKVWNYLRQDVGLIDQLKKKGFDAIIQRGDVPKFVKNGNRLSVEALWGTEYLVFEANQVKSATVKKSFYLEFFDDIRFKDGGYVRI